MGAEQDREALIWSTHIPEIWGVLRMHVSLNGDLSEAAPSKLCSKIL